MDWSTVILSTGVSAVVGSVVSLLAVSQTTIRQRRAERHDQARQDLRKLLAPLRTDLRKYQSRMNAGLKREDLTTHHGDDYALASQVLVMAEQLSNGRRWLVRRRTRRLLGSFMFNVADIAPLKGDTLGALAPLLVAQYDPSKANVEEADDRFGELHRALMTNPGSPELAKLERELGRLAAGR